MNALNPQSLKATPLLCCWLPRRALLGAVLKGQFLWSGGQQRSVPTKMFLPAFHAPFAKLGGSDHGNVVLIPT